MIWVCDHRQKDQSWWKYFLKMRIPLLEGRSEFSYKSRKMREEVRKMRRQISQTNVLLRGFFSVSPSFCVQATLPLSIQGEHCRALTLICLTGAY